MTQNQIAYWNYRENQRTNRANEFIKHEQNHLNYDLGLKNLDETIRSNKTREQETNRHNIATEAAANFKNQIDLMQAYTSRFQADTAKYQAETGRMQVGLGYANLGLGYANLAELGRSNLANEALKRENNTNTFLKDRETYSIATRNVAELQRHNLAVEDENHRNNVTNQLLSSYRLLNDINLGTANVGLSALNSVNNLFKTNGKGGLYSYGF